MTLCGIPGEMGLPRLVTREVAAASVRNDMPHLFGVIRWANVVAMRISAVMAVGILIAAVILTKVRPSVLPLVLVAGAPIVPLMVLSRLRGGALQGLHHIVRGQIPANFLRPVALSLLIFLTVAILFPVVTILVAKLIRPSAPFLTKLEAYECGIKAASDSRGRYTVRFYIIAILFVIFDVETIFLFPWAVRYRLLSWFGVWEVAVFLAILVVGYIWAYKKGALEWV